MFQVYNLEFKIRHREPDQKCLFNPNPKLLTFKRKILQFSIFFFFFAVLPLYGQSFMLFFGFVFESLAS